MSEQQRSEISLNQNLRTAEIGGQQEQRSKPATHTAGKPS